MMVEYISSGAGAYYVASYNYSATLAPFISQLAIYPSESIWIVPGTLEANSE